MLSIDTRLSETCMFIFLYEKTGNSQFTNRDKLKVRGIIRNEPMRRETHFANYKS